MPLASSAYSGSIGFEEAPGGGSDDPPPTPDEGNDDGGTGEVGSSDGEPASFIPPPGIDDPWPCSGFTPDTG